MFSGGVAIEEAAAGVDGLEDFSIDFTGGRSDADSSTVRTPAYLESRLTGGRSLNTGTIGTIDIMRDTALVMGALRCVLSQSPQLSCHWSHLHHWHSADSCAGLTDEEFVALVGGGHSLGQTHSDRSGFQTGSWTTDPTTLDTEFFKNLVTLQYTPVKGADKNHLQWQAELPDGSQTVFMLNTDMNLLWDVQYRNIAQRFAEEGGDQEFYTAFASAWVKVMNADRFDLTKDAARGGSAPQRHQVDGPSMNGGEQIGMGYDAFQRPAVDIAPVARAHQWNTAEVSCVVGPVCR